MRAQWVQTAEIADWFQYLVCVRWAFVTLCPPGTNAKFVLRFYVFLCCASLFWCYCPVLLWNGSVSCWQLVTRVKLSFTLVSVHCWLLPCSLCKHPHPRTYYWICLSAWWTLSSLVTHNCILCFWLWDDLDVQNRMRNAVQIVSGVPAVLCIKRNNTLLCHGEAVP